MKNRLLTSLQANNVDPERIMEACEYIFAYLDKKGFSIRETVCLADAIPFAVKKMTAGDPFRKVGEFDYSNSLKSSLSQSTDS